jgi:D-psicose/D-tagatose/L-ribulose 3-epimerase
MPITYAVHAYAWTSSWSNDDLALVEHVKELGFDAIEIPLMELERVDPDAIRERVEAAGLDVVTSVVVDEATDPTSESPDVRRAGREFLERCVDATAAMGATSFSGVIYAAHGRRLDRRPERSDWERSAEVLRDVARYAAEWDVTLGIEPVNRYETFLVNTAEQGRRLRELIGEPNVGVHLDAYHMNLEEDDFYEPTRATLPCLVHYHLSESHRGIPGRGTVDWEAIMGALVEGGYEGYVGLESFIDVSDAMREATCVWRDMAPSSDALVGEGLRYLRGLEERARSRTSSVATASRGSTGGGEPERSARSTPA